MPTIEIDRRKQVVVDKTAITELKNTIKDNRYISDTQTQSVLDAIKYYIG